MKRKSLLLWLGRVLILLVCLSGISSNAQNWSGILSSSRAVDWSSAGVTGGIPARTQCGATVAAGSSAATINSRLAGCAANTYLLLAPGTFNLSAGIDFAGRSNVTLRGAGAEQTFLVFSGSPANCFGGTFSSSICIEGNDLGFYTDSPAHVFNWTGTTEGGAGVYPKGATHLTLAGTTGLSVGMYLMVDQLDDTTNPGTDLYVCASATYCVDEGGQGSGRSSRGQRQIVQVTNISGSTVTISPGIFMPNYVTAKSPQAFWGTTGTMAGFNGVEDLSIDGTNGGAGRANITIFECHDCWIKGVRSINAPSPQAHFSLVQCVHCTVRDNYLYGSAGDAGASRNYGVEAFGADAILVENNICQRRSPCYMADGDTGSVWGYNFSIYDHYTQSPTFLQGGDYTHETGNAMSLREGNVGTAYMMDNIHATSNLGTTFRNRWSGGASGKSANTIAIGAVTHNRYYNHVGNVLGTSGYHTAYQALESYNNLAVWELGGGSNNWPSDSVVAATTMRWGNYDTVNNAARFVSGEVPSGIAKYPNAVPASQTLPASFYLNSKPAWFGAIPWPPIGPDVTGGNIANVGGHANKIPAQVCWETANAAAGQPADGSGKPVSFNADNCYTDASAGAPVAPTGLTVVVQ